MNIPNSPPKKEFYGSFCYCNYIGTKTLKATLYGRKHPTFRSTSYRGYQLAFTMNDDTTVRCEPLDIINREVMYITVKDWNKGIVTGVVERRKQND